ncbi:D-3-phosphoglycerate dehydrogenase, chloroplastic [Hordeum vulgare]|nr:D-3-phosphoglycerate dehydrogenase, chloroplastic [Hordeum vulgare]
MLRHLDHARRPRATRSVTIPSPAIDQAVFFLRSHAVTLTAADGVNATSPMAVGRALEGLLSVPVHSLRVTAHHPEHFLVLLTQPAHQVNAVRRGSIRVEGASFNIASWHEHDHAVFDSLLLHVRVVVEMMPMQFWPVEGAEEILGKRVRVDRLDSRTLERGHTKTFACWVWTSDIDNIPTSHTMAVLPRGAGRVEEMEGFSPSDSRVAPPPATADYTMLIHVDRIEDWTPPSPRSSHSGQSGLPSSGSDDDSTPFPVVAPATWKLGVEDGQGKRPCRRLLQVGVEALNHLRFRRQHGTDVHAAIEVVVNSPLEFDAALLLNDPSEAVQLDAFSPTLSAAASDMGQYNRATPTPACTMQLQLGAVTGRVSKLQLGAAAADRPETRGLFRASKQALIAAAPAPAPARRPAAPPKSRASSTPTRHSARQAVSGSTVPVAQRASLRLVKELGLLGPRDKMTDEVARALLQRFDEPLSDSDLAVIAKLTRLDSEALRVMTSMIGPEGAADEAMVKSC